MTIDELNALTTLTAADEVPVWDSEGSDEPTKKITASNLAASVKSLASLPNTTEMNTAIAQSTAIVNDKIDKLNSNISSLKLWIGTIPFVFDNTDSASVSFKQISGIYGSRLVSIACMPTGYAQATFGMDSQKNTLTMQTHQAYSITLNVMVVAFYS
jgi:hypothetical protein